MKEFNLKEQRRKLFSSLQGKAFDIMWLFRKLNEQDKEFIQKLLTPNNISKGFVEVRTIKYYAGDFAEDNKGENK